MCWFDSFCHRKTFLRTQDKKVQTSEGKIFSDTSKQIELGYKGKKKPKRKTKQTEEEDWELVN